MKRNATILMILLFELLTQSLFAQLSPNDHIAAYEHLYEVNKQWEKHKEVSSDFDIHFDNDIDRIQFHLLNVVKSLRQNTPAGLSNSSQSNRLSLIDTLEHYAYAKVFPTNSCHSERTPYFIDDFGVYCAVGYMIKASGRNDLALRIQKEHNYDYIADIKTPGVEEWAAEFGFEVGELAWVQPTYSPPLILEEVSEGADGPVKVLASHDQSNILYLAGDFNTVNQVECNNFAFYQSGQLRCMFGVLEGTVNDILFIHGTVYAFGAFQQDGITYPIARFDVNRWTMLSLPGREGAEATLASKGGLLGQMEVVISHPSFVGYQELWVNYNNQWERRAKVKGHVNAMSISYSQRVYAGKLDSVYIYEGGNLVTDFSTNNVFINSFSPLNSIWEGISGDLISKEVKCIVSQYEVLYFGGVCSVNPENGENDICMTRYLNNTLQPTILSNDFTWDEVDYEQDFSINDMISNGSEFIIGGEFDMLYDFMGYYGKNLATYYPLYNTIEPLALLNGSVEVLRNHANYVYIGGNFTSNASATPLNYIARIDKTNAFNEIRPLKGLNLYPNPAQNSIKIEGISSQINYAVYSSTGQNLLKGVSNEQEIDVSELEAGTYIIHIQTKEGQASLKFVKM